ncbi:MAG: hypothetical protein R3D56_03435 [Paracoccaceae bacterium]
MPKACLHRRWREADQARLAAETDLEDPPAAAAQAEIAARAGTKAREAAEDRPPLPCARGRGSRRSCSA